jgi:hypothetical protein
MVTWPVRHRFPPSLLQPKREQAERKYIRLARCPSGGGINVLVKFNKRLQADGRELWLVCDEEHVLRPMVAIGLDRFFRIFANLPEALTRGSRRSRPRHMAAA